MSSSPRVAVWESRSTAKELKHQPKSKSFIRKSSEICAVSLFGIVIGLLGVELVFRAFMFLKSTPPAWSDRPAYYYQHSNSETIQDYPFLAEKPKDVYRIAVIGDSFTFASRMQFTDAFPKKLEQLLNLSGTNKRVEVINYGVPGYSTDHEIATTRKALEHKADLVILQVTLNDTQKKPYRPSGIAGKNDFGAFTPSASQQRLFSWWKSLGFAVERIHNTKTSDAYKDYFFKLFESKQNWEIFNKSIRKITRYTRKENVPILGVVFPLFGLPLNEDYPFHELHSRVHKVFDKNQIPWLDSI